MTETPEAPWLEEVAAADKDDEVQVPIGGQIMTVVMRTPVAPEPIEGERPAEGDS